MRAQRIGLVHEVVEGDAALDAAVEAAVDDVLAAGPTAARAAKAIIREVRGLSHGVAKWHTARVIARQRVTPEAQRGLPAFDENAPARVDRPGRGDGPERELGDPGRGRDRGVGVGERLAPRALGRDFRWLWAASLATNLGDGVLLAAGPLLVTTMTREPFAIARLGIPPAAARGSSSASRPAPSSTAMTAAACRSWSTCFARSSWAAWR